MDIVPGVHSIPAMHTTHKHIEAFTAQRETLRASWRYLTGMDGARYPMPALPMSVKPYANPVVNGPTHIVIVWHEGMDNGEYYFSHNVIPLG